MDNQNQNQAHLDTNQLPPQITQPTPTQAVDSSIRKVEKISAWVLIFSAILFALVAIVSIWGAFGSNNNVAWKAASSLGIIAITSLVVNIGARIYEGKRK